jgi:hypothetical protein
MESAHPNPSHPSPGMTPASPTSMNIKVAAATHIPAAAAADYPFESIGLRKRQIAQVPPQIRNETFTAASIGNLA